MKTPVMIIATIIVVVTTFVAIGAAGLMVVRRGNSGGTQKSQDMGLPSEVKLPQVNGKQPTVDGIRGFGLTTARSIFHVLKRFATAELDDDDVKVEPAIYRENPFNVRENTWNVTGLMKWHDKEEIEQVQEWMVVVTVAEASDSETYRALELHFRCVGEPSGGMFSGNDLSRVQDVAKALDKK